MQTFYYGIIDDEVEDDQGEEEDGKDRPLQSVLNMQADERQPLLPDHAREGRKYKSM